MVDFVLDYLRGVAGERLRSRGERRVDVRHLDALIARAGAHALKGKAALLGLVFARRFDDFGVVHEQRRALVARHDDALAHADHVRGKPHAFVLVRGERVDKVLPYARVRRGGVDARHREQDGGRDDCANHEVPFYASARNDRAILALSRTFLRLGRANDFATACRGAASPKGFARRRVGAL